MELNTDNLIAHLRQNGVGATVSEINSGPVVTQYRISLDNWAKMKKVAKIFADDRVRVAMIPNKPLLGLEFINSETKKIEFEPLINAPEFIKSTHKIPMILGVDIAGKHMTYDLTTAPHILIGGRTGSGKSMFLQSILASIASKLSPEVCKFIIIDTKGVDFENWDNNPRLMMPVIKLNPMESIKALESVTNEIDARYEKLRTVRVKDITKYNATVAADKKMPYIVVAIDEFADLGAVGRKKFTEYIQNITQRARAVGIHLIMATQRPDSDVITGIIAANFPTCVAFQTRNTTHSKRIIGDGDAEKLAPHGDALLSLAGRMPVRIHTPYISNDAHTKYCK